MSKSRLSFFALATFYILLCGCVINTSGSSRAHADINTFNDCVRAGYPVMRSMPARCGTPDGKVFTDTATRLLDAPDVHAHINLCKDLCGDGVCQEIVCMGEGCPCAESATRCPQDCH